MQFTDTHCHIHSADYEKDAEIVYETAIKEGISKIICVGTDVSDSKRAQEFALVHENAWASIGVHPHEVRHGYKGLSEIARKEKVVAIGEIGLDYFYAHSPRETQIAALEAQIQLALDHNLPIIFHIREAFEDFWPIFGNFSGVRGVLHSFTDAIDNLEKALSKDLFIGINGISTFTKSEVQKTMFQQIPMERLLLETDAPYLTPSPLRGRVNEPAYVRRVAEHLATVTSTPVEEIATRTTYNATHLFQI